MKHLSSRKPRDLSSVLEQLRHVDLQQRTTIRATSRKCIVPPTILFRRLKRASAILYERGETSSQRRQLEDSHQILTRSRGYV
ncbi:hypothetical protein GQ600_15665 [Phytophthora cactorum]|nr:hypothetical protein GQ600_15665 [Phytophthora cactorum]